MLGAFDAAGPVVAFELDGDALVMRDAVDVKSYKDIPRYPGGGVRYRARRGQDVTAERVEQALRSAGGKLLDSVRLFDVYEGDKVGEGKKSLAYSLEYRAADRTLTDEEVGPRTRSSSARSAVRWVRSSELGALELAADRLQAVLQ